MALYHQVVVNADGRRKRKQYRPWICHLQDSQLEDHEIYKRYRFNRAGIAYIAYLIGQDLSRITPFGRPLTVEMQLCAALRYIGTASLQLSVADTLNISQPTASRCLWRVCDAIIQNCMNYIRWPENIEQEKMEFFNIAGFPGIVGAVDGCQIRIMEPKKDNNPNSYINRKHFPSINLCAVCDHSGKFTFVNVKWPGSCHDSFILRQTRLWDDFENGIKSGIILGDSGYCCKRWLLTPYHEPRDVHQERYNTSHMRTRTVIESSFGRLKRRFS